MSNLNTIVCKVNVYLKWTYNYRLRLAFVNGRQAKRSTADREFFILQTYSLSFCRIFTSSVFKCLLGYVKIYDELWIKSSILLNATYLGQGLCSLMVLRSYYLWSNPLLSTTTHFEKLFSIFVRQQDIDCRVNTGWVDCCD